MPQLEKSFNGATTVREKNDRLIDILTEESSRDIRTIARDDARQLWRLSFEAAGLRPAGVAGAASSPARTASLPRADESAARADERPDETAKSAKPRKPSAATKRKKRAGAADRARANAKKRSPNG